MGGAACAVLGAEVCAPLLLLCWLCCWPDDASSDTSSKGKHPRKPAVAKESVSRRRSSELFARRLGTSAASLHLPSTSGHTARPLSAHRSHEELPQRAGAGAGAGAGRAGGRAGGRAHEAAASARHHSAPSVIHEVLHRRDWERSSKDLYIPLRPPAGHDAEPEDSDASSPEAPHAEPESSSVEGCRSEERLCKKHYTNIKSSRNRTQKESTADDVKDTDATESGLTFYIGDLSTPRHSTPDINNDLGAELVRLAYRLKEDKQSFNESVKSKEWPPREEARNEDLERSPARVFRTEVMSEVPDRSGAAHRSAESRGSGVTCASPPQGGARPPPSVAAVGYPCCLPGEGEGEGEGLAGRVRALSGAGCGRGVRGARGRHASDGDVAARAQRPESGAFSESDLELELDDERPPPYDELETRTRARETAI